MKREVERKLREVEEEIRATQEAITDSTIDLEIINKVFFKPGTYRQSVFVSQAGGGGFGDHNDEITLPEEPLGFDLPIRAKPEQRLLLLFVLIGFLLEILITDSKIGFLNVIFLLLSLLSTL